MYLFGYSSPIDWWLHLCTQIVLLFQNLEVYRSETLRRVCILFGIVVERILLNTGANVIVHKIVIVIPCSLWLLLRPIIRNVKECYVLYCNKVTENILIPKITRYFLLHRTRPILLKHSIIQPTSVLLPECQNAKAIWGSNFKSLNPQSPNLHNTHKNKYGHILRIFYQL